MITIVNSLFVIKVKPNGLTYMDFFSQCLGTCHSNETSKTNLGGNMKHQLGRLHVVQ
jgi:hypothetical protein